MKLPANITIELCQADPTKGHRGWLARVTWTDRETGKRNTINYFADNLTNQPWGLEDTLRHIAGEIEADVGAVNALNTTKAAGR
jgi:hypothetical protein